VSGAAWRTAALARLADEPFDALIVGGGATGAAIARDAALRGLRVALCDRGDFAGQTSSQSSKLIHGGLRYLQYGDLPLVFEGLSERHRLLATAPHLCRPIEFLFPAYRDRAPSLAALTVGVTLYDGLALWRSPVKSRRLSAAETYREAPALRSAGLHGSLLYVDCQTDDARLVLENVLDAEAAGAVVASYVHVRAEGRRFFAEDRLGGNRFSIRALAVVNAAGPFSDAFRQGRPVLRPTLGVHLVFDAARLPTAGRAIVIHSPRDGRLIFTLPAGARTIVGTTDTDWGGRSPAPGDEIRARRADVDYLLEATNHSFPPVALGPDQVVSTFAGLRPLIHSDAASASATSREHDIWVDRAGVLTVAGGKLTTMRRMAQEAVDRLADLLRARGLDRPIGRCQTATRPLPGGTHPPQLDGHELAGDVRTRLCSAYGSRAAAVAALAVGHEGLARRILPDLPYLRAEVVFAARHDHAVEIEDVLRRRVPIFRDAPDQGASALEDVSRLMGAELDWSEPRRARSVARYQEAAATARMWRQD
jgi:glycerol-3-phosphate dehydrogenase